MNLLINSVGRTIPRDFFGSKGEEIGECAPTICPAQRGYRFHYKEDTQLRMPGRPDLFHHTDENTLSRVTG
jgi:hypothetical protein